MTEENKETISLTLEPEQEPVSRTLTEPALATPKQEVAEPLADVHIDTTQFSEQEMKMIEDFASKINIKDTNQIIQYGSAPQKSWPTFRKRRWKASKPKIWAMWATCWPTS